MTHLASPEGAWLRREITTARAWGVPHSTITGSREPGVWTHRDRLLAVAITELEADEGPCGHRHSISTGDDMDGAYEVDDDLICHACAAVDDWRRSTEQTTPGQLVRVVDTRPSDEDLT